LTKTQATPSSKIYKNICWCAYLVPGGKVPEGSAGVGHNCEAGRAQLSQQQAQAVLFTQNTPKQQQTAVTYSCLETTFSVLKFDLKARLPHAFTSGKPEVIFSKFWSQLAKPLYHKSRNISWIQNSAVPYMPG
jgi:hypothetical protein